MKRWLLLGALLMSFSAASFAKDIRLDWTYKSHDGVLKIIKAKNVRGRIVFDAIIHNTSKEDYRAFYIYSSDDQIHMDDELANEYRGLDAKVLGGKDHKLAPNQRKKVQFSIPEPKADVSLVNLHLGFRFDSAYSSTTPPSYPLIREGGMDFHKLDWDVSELMSN